jgi:hypothetical protein
MRRARLRTGHVFRCVVYSGDIFVWVGAVAVFLQVANWLFRHDFGPEGQTLRLELAALAAAILNTVATYRLGVAYRDYLHFDRPWAAVVAIQVVVTLLLAAFAGASREFYRFFL